MTFVEFDICWVFTYYQPVCSKMEIKVLAQMLLTIISIIALKLTAQHYEDPISCIQALMNGTYHSCAYSVNKYPNTWGVCQLDTCEDKLQLFLHASGQQDPNTTRKVYEFYSLNINCILTLLWIIQTIALFVSFHN